MHVCVVRIHEYMCARLYMYVCAHVCAYVCAHVSVYMHNYTCSTAAEFEL